MPIQYTFKDKGKITAQEKDSLDYLRYADGQMWPVFNNAKKLGIVFLAKTEGIIVAWGLVFERDEEKTFFLYVKKSYRRKGIGTFLYKMATDEFGQLDISKHNRIASSFYESLGI